MHLHCRRFSIAYPWTFPKRHPPKAHFPSCFAKRIRLSKVLRRHHELETHFRAFREKPRIRPGFLDDARSATHTLQTLRMRVGPGKRLDTKLRTECPEGRSLHEFSRGILDTKTGREDPHAAATFWRTGRFHEPIPPAARILMQYSDHDRTKLAYDAATTLNKIRFPIVELLKQFRARFSAATTPGANRYFRMPREKCGKLFLVHLVPPQLQVCVALCDTLSENTMISARAIHGACSKTFRCEAWEADFRRRI